MTITDRFAEAYIEMATKTKVRLEAPSDGLGVILLEPWELNNNKLLVEEAYSYASKMRTADDRGEHILDGCTNWDHNKLFVYLQTASQLCFGGSRSTPFLKKLVNMASEEILRIEKEEN